MTRLLSNLLKVGTTISKSERIINYNDVIRDRVEAMRHAALHKMDSDGFISGLAADVVEELENTGGEESAASAEAELNSEHIEEQAQMILAQANEEAEAVISQAEAQAGQIREKAKEDGYNTGRIEMEKELTERKQQLEQQYAQMQQQLEDEYREMRNRMEPELVETLLEVFAKVTHTISEDNKDIVLHLINGVMKNAENCHEYIIKVSPEDYNFVLNNQGKIYCAMSSEVQIDIVRDSTLKHNECVIETDTGVFNCSLDVELNNLIKDIRLLSCT